MPEKAKQTPRPYIVPAVKRAFEVIDLLASSDDGLTISEIHRRLRLPLSSAATILYTLDNLGYVDRDTDGSRYRLGLRLLRFSRKVLDQLDLVGRCHPILEDLVDETGLTAHMAVLHDGETVYVDRIPGKGLIQFSSYIGMRWPVYATAVGKAILAHLPDPEVQVTLRSLSLKRVTPNTLTSRAALTRHLEEFRRLGYSWEFNEGEVGVACVGAPVFGPAQRVVAAISITGTVQQITEDNLTALGATVRKRAAMMSERLDASS